MGRKAQAQMLMTLGKYARVLMAFGIAMVVLSTLISYALNQRCDQVEALITMVEEQGWLYKIVGTVARFFTDILSNC